MSSAASATAIQSEGVLTLNYTVLAMTTFYLYDWLLNFDREWQVVWTRKLTGASILYILNRYVGIIGQALSIACRFAHLPCTSDYVIFQLSNGFIVLQITIWAAFSSLRVYGICGRQWKIPLLVIIFGMVPAISNLVYFIKWRVIRSSPSSCDIEVTIDPISLKRLVISTEIFQCTADALTLGATWCSTYRTRKLARAVNIKPTISQLLLRDGTLYFGACFILSMLQIFFICVFEIRTLQFGYFSQPITSSLLSHLFLHLRQVYYTKEDTIYTTSALSEARFVPNLFVGNMGAPLADGNSLSVSSSLSSGDYLQEICGAEDLLSETESDDTLSEDETWVVREPFSFGIKTIVSEDIQV